MREEGWKEGGREEHFEMYYKPTIDSRGACCFAIISSPTCFGSRVLIIQLRFVRAETITIHNIRYGLLSDILPNVRLLGLNIDLENLDMKILVRLFFVPSKGSF